MRFAMAAVAAVCVWAGSGAMAFAESPASEGCQGAWQLSSGEADGKALSEAQLKEGKLVIDGDHYTCTLDHVGTMTGTQQLGTDEGLKTIDITGDTGPLKGETCLGLYEIAGDEFRVIFAPPGKARPTSFETAPNSGQWLHTWKRLEK